MFRGNTFYHFSKPSLEKKKSPPNVLGLQYFSNIRKANTSGHVVIR